MNIKNYSSKVDHTVSIDIIRKKLIQAGAKSIIEQYDHEEVCGIAFVLPYNNINFTFNLPARVTDVQRCLIEKLGMKELPAYKQAQKTAWKLIADWIEIQLTMIGLNQADTIELFFPYLTDGNKTFYEKMKANDFKQLV